MRAIFKKYPLFILLLPLSFLLHRYNELYGFLQGRDIVMFLVIVYGITAFAYSLLDFFLHAARRSATIVFLLALLLLYFGAFHDFIRKMAGRSFFSSYTLVLPATLLLFCTLVFFLIRKKNGWERLTVYLNVLFSVFIAADLVLFLQKAAQPAQNRNLIYPEMPISQQYAAAGTGGSPKPDIYFIVLDEYTSSRALDELWHFSNDGITAWLSEKGFRIIPSSKSNYDLTPFSVSSALNMQYIDSGRGDKKYSAGNILQAVKSMSVNETFSILRKEGYTVRFISPFLNSIENSIAPAEFNDFSEKQLYGQTLPARIQKDILWNFSKWFPAGPAAAERAQEKVNRKVASVKAVIQQLNETVDSAAGRRPKFVYAHLMITHSPHLFDTSGNTRSLSGIYSVQPLFNSYIQQVIYANRVIKKLVDTVLHANRKNTVILIQGDHGFRDLPPAMQRYHFPNFSAVYFPDRNYEAIYDSMSSVNTFRVLFNHYFQQHLPLLKDTSLAVKFKQDY